VKVLFLQQQPCMRARKLAIGLRSALPELELGFAYQGKTLSQWYGTGDELFARWWDLGDDPRGRLAAALAEWTPDLVHSHNLPDTLTVLAQELVDGRIPVVHDVHDLQSLRRTPYENGFPQPAATARLERRAIEGSAAVVTVSEELLDKMATRYRLPEHTLVFPNYALRRDLAPLDGRVTRRGGWPPRLVYQGTLSTNGGHYDLREIFRELVATGATLDVYPSRPVPEYEGLAAETPGLTVHETLDPAALLRLLPQYDFGWAGFNDSLNKAHIDTALPNKLFEYVAAGLPVLSLRHRAILRFLHKRRLGIALDTPSALPEALLQEHVEELRQRVSAAREAFTVEANAMHIAGLYRAVSEAGEPVIGRA